MKKTYSLRDLYFDFASILPLVKWLESRGKTMRQFENYDSGLADDYYTEFLDELEKWVDFSRDSETGRYIVEV